MKHLYEISSLNKVIAEQVSRIEGLEKSRKEWTTPQCQTIYLGKVYTHVVRHDYTTTPALRGVQAEMLKAIDSELIHARGALEGAVHKLNKLIKGGV